MAVILRHNMGSHRLVKQVFAFDPTEGTALVLFQDPHNGDRLDLAEVRPNELEALDEKRQYVDVAEQLKKRADFILNRE